MTMETSLIADFYKDRDVFITGATGFMGKVLLEKLLRSCPGIKTIYILLRQKKGQHVKERLQQLRNSKVFDRVHEEQPSAFSKIVALHGDIEFEDLGLSLQDRELLISNVSVVFHSAANVRFEDHLRTSVEQNVLGTKNVINLCKKVLHLEAFIHVSTAYCNCDREEIEEIVYPAPLPPDYVLDTVKYLDGDLISTITPKLLKGRPNTYTYTKALAESLICQECTNLPVAIVRPSIVIATWNEPYPGWIDNINGPTGIYIGTSKGIIRTMLLEKNKVVDYMPVDIVINLMISVAWHTAVARPANITVYNCTSGGINTLTWGDMERMTFPMMIKNPSTEIVRYPSYDSHNSRFVYSMKAVVQHYIPACLIDFYFMVTGKKPRMIKLYNQIHRAIDVMHPFTTNDWKFHCHNMFHLMEKMTPFDRQVFNFDISTLTWSSYMEDYILGIRRFLMKEDISTLSVARKSLKKLYWKTQMFNCFATIGFVYFLLKSRSALGLIQFFMIIAVKIYRFLPFTSD